LPDFERLIGKWGGERKYEEGIVMVMSIMMALDGSLGRGQKKTSKAVEAKREKSGLLIGMKNKVVMPM
jgi:hypothetical protein